MNKNTVKLIGFAGLLLGGLATLVSGWSQERQMDLMIEEKVKEALASEEESE